MGNKEKLSSLTLAFSQVTSAGKLQGQDMLQMINSGFNPLQEIVKMTGKSMSTLRKEMEGGKISSDMVAEAFKHATSAGGLFYGMTDLVGKSAGGKLSTLMDTLNEKLLMIYDVFSGSFMSAIDFATSALESLGNGIKFIIDWTQKHKTIIELIANVLKIATAAFLAYKTVIVAQIAISKLSAAWTLIQIASLYTAAGAAGGLSVVMTVLTAVQYAWNVAVTANPIGLIIAGIAAFVAIIYLAYTKLDGFRKFLYETWEVLKTFGNMVGTFFKGIGQVIAGAITFNPALITQGLSNVTDAFKDYGTKMGDAIADGKHKYTQDWIKKNTKESLIKGKTGKPGEAGEAANQPQTKAEGQKTINIHIAYNAPLIQGFTISTTNINEGLGSLKEKITEILAGATRDTVVMAEY